jgi:acyl carrier protein
MNAPLEPLTETTAQGVAAVIAEQLGIALTDVKPELRFAADLNCDSLDSIELLMALEDEFAIRIEDNEMAAVSTVQEAVDLVNAKLIQAAAPKRHGVPA